MNEIKQILEQQGADFQKFVDGYKAQTKQYDEMFADLAKRTRPGSYVPPTPDSKGITREIGEALRKALNGDDREIKAMATSPEPSGGYLIVEQVDQMINKIRADVSPFSTLVRTVVLTEGNQLTLPHTLGTMASGWVAEQDSRPETDTPEVGEHNVPLFEVYACPKVTQRLLDDAHWDVGGYIVEAIGHGLGLAEDTALHSGSGIHQPRGILTYTTAATGDSTRAFGTVQHIPTGASGAFHTNKGDPLFDVVASLRTRYRPNARWLMNRSTAATLRKMKAVDTGEYFWQPGLQMGQPDTLLGFPVVIDDTMPDIAADSLSIAFGDFAQAYCRVERPGLKLLRDPYTVKGQVFHYAYRRVGGGMVNSEAVKFLKFSGS